MKHSPVVNDKGIAAIYECMFGWPDSGEPVFNPLKGCVRKCVCRLKVEAIPPQEKARAELAMFQDMKKMQTSRQRTARPNKAATKGGRANPFYEDITI